MSKSKSKVSASRSSPQKALSSNTSITDSSPSMPYMDRLSAIKFEILSSFFDSFGSGFKIFKEIIRCKPNIQKEKVKGAFILENRLTITTDDRDTHNALSQQWPTDAFSSLIKPITSKERHSSSQKQSSSSFSIIIRNVDLREDLNDQDLANQLLAQGLCSWSRIIMGQLLE
ncbi:hypothetical protein BpHYR1_030084 [Brachionus plicatilis]|uniref:Uncharacterized protein n=1 Tax=Brachionus plicatilis TaxID=10195 RepID=A0A3M7RQZ3_BRAPC|nr:hypothetical protein BpHYR1_030084 [Brachionus plicatilis]